VTASRLWEMIYLDKEKDGLWDKSSDEVRCYKDGAQQDLERDPLAFFDKMIGYFIRQGYFVDMLACNPAIRSFWKKFWRDILERSCKADRQTDRQAELISETVNIPTYNADDSDSGEEESEGVTAETGSGRSGDEDGSTDSSEGRDESVDSEADADDDWQGS